MSPRRHAPLFLGTIVALPVANRLVGVDSAVHDREGTMGISLNPQHLKRYKDIAQLFLKCSQLH